MELKGEEIVKRKNIIFMPLHYSKEVERDVVAIGTFCEGGLVSKGWVSTSWGGSISHWLVSLSWSRTLFSFFKELQWILALALLRWSSQLQAHHLLYPTCKIDDLSESWFSKTFETFLRSFRTLCFSGRDTYILLVKRRSITGLRVHSLFVAARIHTSWPESLIADRFVLSKLSTCVIGGLDVFGDSTLDAVFDWDPMPSAKIVFTFVTTYQR